MQERADLELRKSVLEFSGAEIIDETVNSLDRLQIYQQFGEALNTLLVPKAVGGLNAFASHEITCRTPLPRKNGALGERYFVRPIVSDRQPEILNCYSEGEEVYIHWLRSPPHEQAANRSQGWELVRGGLCLEDTVIDQPGIPAVGDGGRFCHGLAWLGGDHLAIRIRGFDDDPVLLVPHSASQCPAGWPEERPANSLRIVGV